MEDLSKLDITPEQQKELDALYNNSKLIKYMGAGLTNTGEESNIDKIMERQERAINVLSKKDESFWSFE